MEKSYDCAFYVVHIMRELVANRLLWDGYAIPIEEFESLVSRVSYGVHVEDLTKYFLDYGYITGAHVFGMDMVWIGSNGWTYFIQIIQEKQLKTSEK